MLNDLKQAVHPSMSDLFDFISGPNPAIAGPGIACVLLLAAAAGSFIYAYFQREDYQPKTMPLVLMGVAFIALGGFAGWVAINNIFDVLTHLGQSP